MYDGSKWLRTINIDSSATLAEGDLLQYTSGSYENKQTSKTIAELLLACQ